ncbi:MAG: RAMP superfamily CRISPR-associated protein, partial [Candidatus Desantisbacteria bacterium]
MSFDYYCQIISEYTELERSREEAEKQTNRDKAREIDGKINSIYDNHPSLLYYHLTAQKRDADNFRGYWLKHKRKEMPDKNFGVKIGSFESTIIPEIDPDYLSPLPKYSFAIQFKFTLAKSYISKDDKEFYILDNPVKKDWVFKVPMVSSSTWKGHLRWTMRKNEGLLDEPVKDDDKEIIRLFGHQKGEEGVDKQRRGRLIFFPTFMDMIDAEVINPHDRATKAGTSKGPIFIEVVPENATGTFTLLYVPFDLIGKLEDEVKDEVAQDLKLIGEAIKEMMTTYGFSAKKTSGFGVIKEEVDRGKILLKASNPNAVHEIEAIRQKLESLKLTGSIKEDDLSSNGEFIIYEKFPKEWNKGKKKKYRE